MEQARSFLEDVAYADDPCCCAEGADAQVIVTEWDAYRALDFARLSRSMAAAVLVDLRNIYCPDDVRRAGFKYESVGLGEKQPYAAHLHSVLRLGATAWRVSGAAARTPFHENGNSPQPGTRSGDEKAEIHLAGTIKVGASR